MAKQLFQLLFLLSLSSLSRSSTPAFFQPDRALNLTKLGDLQRSIPKVYMSHYYGDVGFTQAGFHGNSGAAINAIMLNRTWSWRRLVPVANMSHADWTHIKQTTSSLVDAGAWEAVSELHARGWLRAALFWQLTEVFIARLMQNDHGWLVRSPDEASLVMLNGNSKGAQDYLAWERAKGLPLHAKRHFGVNPYARPSSFESQSEYRVDSVNRSSIKCGRIKHGDVAVPMLTPLMPSGVARLSDFDKLYTKERAWLLSFVGSAYRPGEPGAYLSYERYPVVSKLMRLALAYEQQGVLAFESEALRTCTAKLPGVAGLRAKESLFIAPTTALAEGDHDAMLSRFRTNNLTIARVRYTKTSGSLGNNTYSETPLMAAVYMLHASSIFSLQLPGDGPYRTSQINAMTMGAIPVIVDWQANALASWFEGLFYKSQDRLEDIFIILDWRAAHERPEYILHRLCEEVASGNYLKRQRRLRRLVDFLVYRTDSNHEDAFSTAVKLVQQQHMRLQANESLVYHPKVQEWPHEERLRDSLTQANAWTSGVRSYGSLRRQYSALPI
eukprot:m.105022 g.105022  ORF g.105022 m.105022 type:complete len:555 (-) comp15269_c0_seq1:2095-3759(-)